MQGSNNLNAPVSLLIDPQSNLNAGTTYVIRFAKILLPNTALYLSNMKIYSRNFNSGTKLWTILNRKLSHDVFYTTNYVPSLSTIPFVPAFAIN